ncbi:hypothetical protein DOY81_004648 [Sarcophaga bullata]|nr:hypothetical protein DOY81_004648 [Sarcophaga bullata]
MLKENCLEMPSLTINTRTKKKIKQLGTFIKSATTQAIKTKLNAATKIKFLLKVVVLKNKKISSF